MPTEQTYRIEVRFDFTGTEEGAKERAQAAANSLDGEVTAILDENWEDV